MSYDSQRFDDDQRGDHLPTVEPPTAGFILQLFLIPLLIVSIVIALWLLFSWLAHAGQNDPQAVLNDLQRMGSNSFQRAHELATMLQEQSEQGDKLRHDPAFAGEVGKVLQTDLKMYPAEITDSRAKLRMFLCGALAEFDIPEAVPPLVAILQHTGEGGTVSSNPAVAAANTFGAEVASPIHNVQVRMSAAESLAKLSARLGNEEMRALPEVVPTLIETSRLDARLEEADAAAAADLVNRDPRLKSGYRPHAELRAVSAYALGVIGGEVALDRLQQIAENDPYANARYNAATGLARYGDERVIETLLEMLDPNNKAPSENEWHATEQEQALVNVMKTGMQATLKMAQTNPQADLTKLREALENIKSSDLSMIPSANSRQMLSLSATETLRLMDAAQKK